MKTKTDVLEEVEKAFAYLVSLKYSKESYDAGPEYGVIFRSKKRNRVIHIILKAYTGGIMECNITRLYPKYFPFIYKSFNEKVFISINDMFKTDDEFSKLNLSFNVDNKREVINNYARYVETKLAGIISGESWIN
ncbi:MAG: hypothetical protein WDA22_17185 [Bacteroidota bacterium]